MGNNEINCLLCVRCKLIKGTRFHDSDLADKNTMIFCEKMDARRIINLHGCPIANPERHKTFYREDGDLSFYMTPVEREFLRIHFPRGDEAMLCRVLQRSWRSVCRRVRRNTNFKRDPRLVLENIRSTTTAARAAVKSPRFNEAQRFYIADRFTNGPWPTKTCPQATNTRARNAEIKAEIVRDVASLGATFSWQSILNHAHEMQPGSKRWRKKWDAQNRRKGVFAPKEAP